MNIEIAFDVLRHPRRRAVVSVLDETESISRRELVARLAAADAEGGAERGARAIEIALQHNHLPRLDDAGVVEYDGETVTATPELETVVEYATVVGEDPASTRYRLGARLARFYA